MTAVFALALAVLAPLAGSACLALYPFKTEKSMARIAIFSALISSLSAAAAIFTWAAAGFGPIESPQIAAVTSGPYKFILGIKFDTAAAAFLFLVEFTSGMVIRFSRIYMHREPGFRRFFAVVLMFQGAMALLTVASNLDLLFCAWEMVGLASFLLIAFYHERRSPVRNALKTFSIYRVADVGMLLGAFLGHHSSNHTAIGLLLLLAAAGKSAQFPFSFWIVRAMEGPTPSSALFYGALSVHAGAYLLLRTYSLWGGIPLVHVCVGLVGLTTAILCSMISRAQHTVKGQIGYASATQVGLIFVELALGLKWLALFHMVSNAILRCYQLLVSPSAVAYLLRKQSSLAAAQPSERHSMFQRILTREARSTLYVFAASEGYLEDGVRLLFWLPLRRIGAQIPKYRAALFGTASALALAGLAGPGHLPAAALALTGAALIAAAAAFSVCAMGAETPVKSTAWLAVSSVTTAVAVFAGSRELAALPGLQYAGGILLASAVALAGFEKRFPGNAAPWAAMIGALGIAGFPLLPTFFGEDILLHAAFRTHPLFAFTLSCLFALNGYLAVRAFAQAFYGPRIAPVTGNI